MGARGRKRAAINLKVSSVDIAAYRQALRSDPCSYCGGVADTLDHIEARAAGGSGRWSNATATCNLCNSGKRDRSLLGYLGWRVHRAATMALEEAILRERRAWSGVGR